MSDDLDRMFAALLDGPKPPTRSRGWALVFAGLDSMTVVDFGDAIETDDPDLSVTSYMGEMAPMDEWIDIPHPGVGFWLVRFRLHSHTCEWDLEGDEWLAIESVTPADESEWRPYTQLCGECPGSSEFRRECGLPRLQRRRVDNPPGTNLEVVTYDFGSKREAVGFTLSHSIPWERRERRRKEMAAKWVEAWRQWVTSCGGHCEVAP